MLKSKFLWRTFALAALGMLLMVQQTSTIDAAAGRDFARCMQSCSHVRMACFDICVTDCDALFPNDQSAQGACTDACRQVCIAETKECKEVCKDLKEDPSPEEP